MRLRLTLQELHHNLYLAEESCIPGPNMAVMLVMIQTPIALYRYKYSVKGVGAIGPVDCPDTKSTVNPGRSKICPFWPITSIGPSADRARRSNSGQPSVGLLHTPLVLPLTPDARLSSAAWGQHFWAALRFFVIIKLPIFPQNKAMILRILNYLWCPDDTPPASSPPNMAIIIP